MAILPGPITNYETSSEILPSDLSDLKLQNIYSDSSVQAQGFLINSESNTLACNLVTDTPSNEAFLEMSANSSNPYLSEFVRQPASSTSVAPDYVPVPEIFQNSMIQTTTVPSAEPNKSVAGNVLTRHTDSARSRPRLHGVSTWKDSDDDWLRSMHIDRGLNDSFHILEILQEERKGLELAEINGFELSDDQEVECRQSGYLDQSEWPDERILEEDVVFNEQNQLTHLHPRLKKAWQESASRKSLNPILKEELRLKIMKKRLDSGQEELAIEFRDPTPCQMTPEEMRRKSVRRAQNRRAAQRFRLKKKSKDLQLQQTVKETQQKNEALQHEILALKESRRQMLQTLLDHFVSGGCRLQQTEVTSLCMQITQELADQSFPASP